MSRAGAVVWPMCRVPPGRRMSDAFITALDGTPPTSSEPLVSRLELGRNRHQPTPTHASGGLDDIATQLPHRPAKTGRARLSRRASPACQRSTPSPVGTSATPGPHASRRPIPFAGAGDAANVHMNAIFPTPGGVGPKELDDQVEEMYDRGLAPEKPGPAPPHGGRTRRGPRLPAALRPRHELAHRQGLRRRRRAAAPRLTIEQKPPIHITSIEKNHLCPHTCIADPRPRSSRGCAHPGASSRNTHGAYRGVAARAQPGPCPTTHYALERGTLS